MTQALRLLLLLTTLLVSVMALEMPLTTDTCELCARDGNCSTAHRSQPGQYCGAYVKHGFHEVCCCGTNQVCGRPAVDLQCECTSIVVEKTSSNSASEGTILLVMLINFVIMCALFWALHYCYDARDAIMRRLGGVCSQRPTAAYARP